MARLIETEADIAEGTAWLAAREPRFAEALALTGQPPLRRSSGGFPGLLRIVVSQQVSTAAAAGIWRRVEDAGADDPAHLLRLDDEALRLCGLSRAKARYARAIAEARLDYPALATLPEADAIDVLRAVPGIGPWTAQLYLMFCVGRADVFAPGDLALAEAARLLFDLEGRPAPPVFEALAAPWSPWRAVAARLLWAYYAAAKRREGVV